jgi:hypothetical protein
VKTDIPGQLFYSFSNLTFEKQAMSNKIIYSKEYVKDACFIFCSEMWSHYDAFLDFLMQETEQRPVLPHYFFSLFENEGLIEKGFENLGLFLYIIVDDESTNYLLTGYMEDTRELLEGLGHQREEILEDIRKLFGAYDTLRQMIKDGADKHSEEFTEIVANVTKGVRGMEDWSRMF